MNDRTARAPQHSAARPAPVSAPAPSAGYPAPWSNQARMDELGLRGGVDPADAAAWELGGPFTPLLLGFATARARAAAGEAAPTVPEDPRALALELIEAALRGEAPPAAPATAAPAQAEGLAPEDARSGGGPTAAAGLLTEALETLQRAVVEALPGHPALQPRAATGPQPGPSPSAARPDPEPSAQRSGPSAEGLGTGQSAGPLGGSPWADLDENNAQKPAPEPTQAGRGGPRGDRARLNRLLSADPMTVEQIAEARGLIASLPEEERAAAYLEVQRRSPYASQRLNEDGREGESGGTCFPTAVAMALMSLGVANPDPSLRYADAIMAMATGDITAVSTWIDVCARLGKQAENLDGKEINAWSAARWQRELGELLGGGGAAVLSITGHVVRVEGWDEGGMIVDDPYGKSVLRSGTGRGWSDRNGRSAGGPEVGEGHSYPWAAVIGHAFNYLLSVR